MCGANWHTGLPIQKKVILFGFPGHGFCVYVLTVVGVMFVTTWQYSLLYNLS